MDTMKQSEGRLLNHLATNQRTVNMCDMHHLLHIHVAVLMRRGKILAEATNAYGSRSRGSGYSARTIHAERNVIKKLGNIQELRGAEMYVTRISRARGPDGVCTIASSAPCHGCSIFLEKCMKEYGLKNVYYT
jgi:deoxycytidylate deaminase